MQSIVAEMMRAARQHTHTHTHLQARSDGRRCDAAIVDSALELQAVRAGVEVDEHLAVLHTRRHTHATRPTTSQSD
jgi:hypothetical protein